MLKEMRLSFPSGHASFSAYTMVYCAVSSVFYSHIYSSSSPKRIIYMLQIFLHARMTWRGSKLLKNFIQFGLILFSWFTCMTRISDYKHHWSDVLAGATLGTIVALVVVKTDDFKIFNMKLYLNPRHFYRPASFPTYLRAKTNL